MALLAMESKRSNYSCNICNNCLTYSHMLEITIACIGSTLSSLCYKIFRPAAANLLHAREVNEIFTAAADRYAIFSPLKLHVFIMYEP